jgi:hypothetical protein
MGVAVDHRLDVVEAVDRVGQARGAEERVDFERLALDRLRDRRIMEHGDAALGAQRAQRVLELARFLVARFVDEGLDRGSPNAPSSPRPKPPMKPLAPAKPTPSITTACSPSMVTPACWRITATSSGRRIRNRDCRAPRHRDRAGAQILGEDLGLAGLAEIGQVAAQSEHVGHFRNLGEQSR